MARILAPNNQYTGVSAGVNFINGVGETTDPHLVDWFRTHGYAVKSEKPEKPDGAGEQKPDGGGK